MHEDNNSGISLSHSLNHGFLLREYVQGFQRSRIIVCDFLFIFSYPKDYSLSYKLFHLLVCKSKNFGSWVYQLMIQFIVVSSFFLQDYISFIFSLVFFFVVFFFGVVVFLLKMNIF